MQKSSPVKNPASKASPDNHGLEKEKSKHVSTLAAEINRDVNELNKQAPETEKRNRQK